jgi:predicted transcriptional regulator
MLTLRLPAPLESRLSREAERRGASKSELVRQALLEFLVRSERRAQLEGMAMEARAVYGDPALRAALDLTDEALDDGLDKGPDDPWWR